MAGAGSSGVGSLSPLAVTSRGITLGCRGAATRRRYAQAKWARLSAWQPPPGLCVQQGRISPGPTDKDVSRILLRRAETPLFVGRGYRPALIAGTRRATPRNFLPQLATAAEHPTPPPPPRPVVSLSRVRQIARASHARNSLPHGAVIQAKERRRGGTEASQEAETARHHGAMAAAASSTWRAHGRAGHAWRHAWRRGYRQQGEYVRGHKAVDQPGCKVKCTTVPVPLINMQKVLLLRLPPPPRQSQS